MLPSPTAAATRLTGPKRTSPQAKMPGHARLQQVRVAVERPVPGRAHVGAGEHVAARVERDLGRQPAGLRVGADEDEQPAGVEPRRLAVARSRTSIASSDASPCTAATSVPNSVRDVRPRRELVDEVARHALLERCRRGRGSSRCARGWRRTAPPGPPSCPRRRCGRRGRACSAPRCAPRRRRCPSRRAGRSRRSASCRQATPQARMIVRARSTSPPSRWTWRVAASIRVDRARDEDLGAEPARLLQRAARELVARHARREAEVVLDPRRRARLAAGRLALDDDRAQALRRAVDGRGEAGGPGADDHRVVLRGARARCRGRAARRPGAAAAGPRSCRRRRGSPAGRPRPAAGRPSARRRRARPGVSHLNVIWLRSRKRRSSVQAASQRCPTTIARGGGGSAARPCSPRAPPIRCAREPADLLRDVGRRRPRRVVVVRPRCA